SRRESGRRGSHPATCPSAAECLHLAGRRQRFERTLHGTLAGSQSKRKRRARPWLTIGEAAKHGRVRILHRRYHYYDLTCLAWGERKATLSGTHTREFAQ